MSKKRRPRTSSRMRSATGRRSARVSDRTTFPEYGIPVCLDPNATNTYDGPMQGVELGALLFGGKEGGSNPCTEMPCYVYPDQSQCDYGPTQRLNASGRGMRSATGEKSLDFQGAAVNVLAVTAIGAVVGALVTKKNKVQSAQIGGGIGLILGIFGGFQVLRTTMDDSKT